MLGRSLSVLPQPVDHPLLERDLAGFLAPPPWAVMVLHLRETHQVVGLRGSQVHDEK